MTRDEIKSEIEKLTERLSESDLLKLLDFVKEIKNSNYKANLEKIVQDNHELLKRLAD